jgi:two-component system OmpR family sensor kinase/two-component system sensor histidine kinase BaeS
MSNAPSPERQRPSWWPEDEPWPPRPRASGMRGRFLRRIALVVGGFVLFIATMNLIFLVAGFAGRAGGHGEWQGPPFFAILVMFGIGVLLVTRFVRRTAMPVGDVMEAASRLSEGDYAARVTPAGPPEVRSLGLAFNQMAERLQSNEAQRRDLLADIAHELRTPLSIIQGNAEGVLDGVYAPDEERMAAIVEEAQVMSRLLEDLRTLSTADAGTLSLFKEGVSPADVIEETLVAFRPQAEAVGINIVSDVEPGLPSIEIDPVRIRSVIANLLTNALRYTPAGGRITLTASVDGQRAVRFAVTDTGSGIAAADLPYVFTRFRKSADSRGTGLGLAIAKSLVEAHGGSIEVESEPGRGTTVSFSLPV